MKVRTFLAGTMAVLALAACNKNKDEAAGTAVNDTVKITQANPPPGGTWADVVNETSAGGFMMGNPKAKVKLVEYGSLTCPHCREFDEKGVPALIDNYVKGGQVSWEFRNYVRDPFDLTATLIARCNGTKGFFPLMRAIYKDQPTWVAKIQSVPQAQLEALQNLPPKQEFVQAAGFAGLTEWAAARGVPQAKSAQCLGNEGTINQLVQMTSDATTQYPDFQGTPTFVINGKMVPNTASWELLEPKLKDALK
ncbi:MAG: thioredoxin domain-containing protein [Sphingomicrobium sp.]